MDLRAEDTSPPSSKHNSEQWIEQHNSTCSEVLQMIDKLQLLSTHRHVLNFRALAQDLNVPQLGEVEISLLLEAINQELQLGDLQAMAQVFIMLHMENKFGETFT